MNIKLLTEHQLEFLSLQEGCVGSSESTLVKMPHCWKSHVAAQIVSKASSICYNACNRSSTETPPECLQQVSMKASPVKAAPLLLTL